MEDEEYLHMYLEEEHHWWYAGMRAIVLALLPPDLLPANPRILDAGCGTGFSLAWFRNHYRARVVGIDANRYGLDFCRRREERQLTCADVTALPFASDGFDAVVSFDVLSEIGEENARASATSEFLRVLVPGGRLLLRLPAYEWLRSRHDTAVSTRHRFARLELQQTLEAAGFQSVSLSFANTILFPAAALWRLSTRAGMMRSGSDVRGHTRGTTWINNMLVSILEAEAAILRRGVRFPFGLSLFAVAAKPRVCNQ